jgi:hypothetical protein
VTRKDKRKINSTGKEFCEVCNEQHFLVQHHILGRKIKRANAHNNLANICSNCHLKIHKGEIIIEKRTMTTAGYVLLWHERTAESVTGSDSQVHVIPGSRHTGSQTNP